MLQRKLLLNLGPMVILLLVASVASIILLQGILRRMDDLHRQAWIVSDEVNSATAAQSDLARGDDGAGGKTFVILSRNEYDRAHQEQEALNARFRWVVLGLSIVFVILINLSVVLLLRLGRIVLKPVDTLVEATRQLGTEHLDYRVQLDQSDEFGELAEALNTLAGRLQANEQRKLETLGQVALAMNHELNNVIAIITLQLRIAGRQAPANAALESCLKQIQGSLARMIDAVKMLKNIRRIVLTDYISGMKMLDLRRSAEVTDVEPKETTAA